MGSPMRVVGMMVCPHTGMGTPAVVELTVGLLMTLTGVSGIVIHGDIGVVAGITTSGVRLGVRGRVAESTQSEGESNLEEVIRPERGRIVIAKGDDLPIKGTDSDVDVADRAEMDLGLSVALQVDKGCHHIDIVGMSNKGE